ncbi:YjjG family noncanonical pyrimidine nucleotidase [Flavobacterium sp.]|uniref:YjjG family noncanonical pyrimidine nucleotidase n=1 Tax=Flavobacterium sp. TaxID=239 RepID=UPI00286EB0B7|nr:YjjG family noncanonical pyrimidine nucleotidase [Flavobacterium sp.]
MYSNINRIFFDLDHTLWDFDKNSGFAFERIFNENKIDINLKDFLHYYIPTNVKYWEMYRKDEITQSELRYGRLKETFDLMDYKTNQATIDFFSHQYIEYLPKFTELFEGAIETLDYLSSKYNLHIITNGFQDVQDKKMSNSNIKHYFKTITNSEMAGVKKPNPIIFEHALQKASAKKEESIMIGDCLEADVGGALNFGMKALFFNSNKIKVTQNINQITNLADLKKLF